MLRWSWAQKTAGMMDRVGRVSVSSAEWKIVAVGSDANERDERGLMRCPQCQKGMGSMAALDGGVMRAVSRLGFGTLSHSLAGALHHTTACRLA